MDKKTPDQARNPIEEVGKKKAPDQPGNPFEITLPGQGQVKITIEIQGQGAIVPMMVAPPRPEYQSLPARPETWRVIPPQDSDRVFVDITAYNSKNYYIQGHVQTPGRMPWTGGETVLDAIQFAGGLLASADPHNIVLVRPGRNGARPRTYPVDFPGIRDRGEAATNYQLFPGDRLLVGLPVGGRRQAHVDPTSSLTRPEEARPILQVGGTASPTRKGPTPGR